MTATLSTSPPASSARAPWAPPSPPPSPPPACPPPWSTAAPLPPMEHAGFRRPRLCDRADLAAACSTPRASGTACPRRPARSSASRSRDGRPGAPRLAARRCISTMPRSASEPFGWMVEARALRVALNARLPRCPACLSSPLRPRRWSAALKMSPFAYRRRAGDPGASRRRRRGAAARRCARRRAFRVTRLDYHRLGIVGAVAHEKPHHNQALEQFLPHGPFAQLPMAGRFGTAAPHVSAIVWTERTAVARRCWRSTTRPSAGRSRRRLGDRLGAVTPIGRRWSYPLSALHARRATRPRLALVGDAAHGIHPIAGQGLNLGFRDVAALAEEVDRRGAGRGGPGRAGAAGALPGGAAAGQLLMLGATHGLERLFSNACRRCGWRGGSASPRWTGCRALKRFFAARAMGLAALPPARRPEVARAAASKVATSEGALPSPEPHPPKAQGPLETDSWCWAAWGCRAGRTLTLPGANSRCPEALRPLAARRLEKGRAPLHSPKQP